MKEDGLTDLLLNWTQSWEESASLRSSHIASMSLICVCCQLLRPDEESTSTQRYIDSRTVPLKAKGAWISVEVTETIKDWVSDPG